MDTVQDLHDAIQEKRDEIVEHPAWHVDLIGPEAEVLLKDQPSGTYLLRQGEKADNYYLSFNDNGKLVHLPVKIDYPTKQWFYLNCLFHYGDSLKGFIPEIMHREEAECLPLVQFAKTK